MTPPWAFNVTFTVTPAPLPMAQLATLSVPAGPPPLKLTDGADV